LDPTPGLGSGGGGAVSAGGDSSAAGKVNAGGGSNTAGNLNGGSSNAGTFTGGGPGNGGFSGGGVGTAGGGGSSSEGPGTITDLWRDLCVATFTMDYPVTDDFGAPLFTARAAEEYLLIRYPGPHASASLAYLTSTGPYEFDVAPNADNTAFPFTTDCPTDLEAASYFAVFADVSVYAEPELVTKICDLEAGEALPRDMTTGAGYGLENSGSDSSIYEVFLNAFSAQCGGAVNGYISVPRIHLFGTARVLVPFQVITAPQ
jgi:hypothetical protein